MNQSPSCRNTNTIIDSIWNKTVKVVLVFCLSLFFFATHSLAQNCASNAGLDQTICSSQSLTLSGQVYQPQSSPVYVRWRQVSGPNTSTITSPASTTTSITGLVPGLYIFEIANACTVDTARDRVAITVLQQTPLVVVGNDTQVCSLSPVKLSGTAPTSGITGTWSATPSTGTFSNASSATATFTPTVNATVYTLRWTLSNGVCSSSATMRVRAVGAVTPVSAGSDLTVSCNGTSTTLNGSNPGTTPPQSVFWSLVSGPNTPIFNSRTIRNPTVSGLVAGTYEFKYDVSGPCASGSDNVVVTVNNIKTPPNAGSNVAYTNYCASGSVTTEVLTGAPLIAGETAKWMQTSGTGATFSPNDYESAVTAGNLVAPAKSWTFTYTKTGSNGCTHASTHSVFRVDTFTSFTVPSSISPACNANPVFDVSWTGASSTVSEGLTRTVSFVSGPATPTGSPSRAGLSTYSDRWTIANLTIPGTYVYLVTYTNRCGSKSAYITLQISRTPGAVNAGSNIIIPCYQNFTFPTGFAATPGSLSWTQVSGPNTATLANVNSAVLSMTNLVSGRYMMRLSNSGGANCPAKADTMTVIVPKQPTTNVILGPDDTVCSGRVRLTGTKPDAGEVGTWTVSPSSGITFSPNANNARAYAVGLANNSVYTFTWTISGTCGNKTDQQVITTTSVAAPPIPNAGTDQCLSSSTSSTTLSGSSPGTATPLWTALATGSSVASPNAQNTLASITGGTGVYAFEYRLSTAGCDNFSDTVVVSINHNVTSVNAGTDKQLCGNSLPATSSLTANVSAPSGASSLWSQISGPGSAGISTPAATSTNVTNLGLGIYEFMYAISVGSCSAVKDTTIIVVASPPTMANAGVDQSLCGTGSGGTASTTLAANTPSSGSGLWSLASGPGTITLSSASSPVATISGLIYGTYALVWNITPASGAGICQTSTDTMLIRVVPSAYAGVDASYCNVSNVQLSGNQQTAGTWSLVSGSPAPAFNNISPYASTASGLGHAVNGNVYVFRYTLPAIGSCPSTVDEITITNYSQPSQADAGADIEICYNQQSVTLDAVLPSSGTGYWTRVSGPGTPTAGTANTTFKDSAIQNLAVGVHTYRFVVNTHSSCLASTDEMLVIRERTASAGNDTAACSPDSILLNGSGSVFNSTTWSVLSGPNTPIFSNSSNPITQIKNLQPGIYDLRFTIAGPVGCPSNSDDMRLTIDEKIIGLNAGRDTQILVNNSVSLGSSPGISGITYLWSPATFLSSTSVSNPLFTVGFSPGVYTYTVSGTRGVCNAADQVVVTVQGSRISGTVRNDADGNIDNDVDGPGAGAGLIAYLLQDGYVVKKTTVNSSNGTYSFLDINTNIDYTVMVNPINFNLGDKPALGFSGFAFVATGEEYGLNNLSGSGLESGSGNGAILVKSGNSFVTDVDFGIDFLPYADFAILSDVINKGGTYRNALPKLSGTDLEDGLCSGSSPFNDTLVIITLPANATLYYNNVAVIAGQVIPNFDDTKLEVDPNFDGASDLVYFYYGWKDRAGFSSNSVTRNFALVLYKQISVVFTVHADGDALLDGQIDGNSVKNLSGQWLIAYLVNENTGLVVDTNHLRNKSTLYFMYLNGYSNYSLRLSTSHAAKGGLPPSDSNIPANWQLTGEQYGINNAAGTGIEYGTPDAKILIQTADNFISDVRFGVNFKPIAHRKKYVVDPNSVTGLTGRARWSFTHWLPLFSASGNADTTVIRTGTGMMPGRLSGYDVEDGRIRGLTGRTTSNVVLRNLPDTGNALLQYESGGLVYFLNPAPSVTDPAYVFWDNTNSRYVINSFNPDNLKLLVKMAYQDSTRFEYAYMDNANAIGSFSSYSINYITPLPIDFAMGACKVLKQHTTITWNTLREEGYHHFDVMRSEKQNQAFVKIGEVKAFGNSVIPRAYQFIDNGNPGSAIYRVDVVKHNNESEQAGICETSTIQPRMKQSQISVYPNPAGQTATINFADLDIGSISLQLINAAGQEVMRLNELPVMGKTTYNLNLKDLAPGIYLLLYQTDNENGQLKVVKE